MGGYDPEQNTDNRKLESDLSKEKQIGNKNAHKK